MKFVWVLVAGWACQAVARPIEVGGLPAWELADTEVSTNVPFAFPQANVKHFFLSMELAGTPSNNVQVAFGRDANTNGVLEVEEAGFAIGWDCGRWRVLSGVRSAKREVPSVEWTAEAVTTNRVKVLDVDLYVYRAKGKRLACKENGVESEWDASPELPRTMYDNSWDTLRLTVRGVDQADESLRAAVRVEGMKIVIQ